MSQQGGLHYNMKAEKGITAVVIILLLGCIVLGIFLYKEVKAKEKILAEADFFTNGSVVYHESGGIVTASLEDWVYFTNDSFVSEENPGGTPLTLIFTDLYANKKIFGLKVKSEKDKSEGKTLVKVPFDKVIFVKTGNMENSESQNDSEFSGRPYYYVDCGETSYYISPTENVPQLQIEKTTE